MNIPYIQYCVYTCGASSSSRLGVGGGDDLDALAGEEADLEAALAPPPQRLLGRGHVDHRYHVAFLQKEKERERELLKMSNKQAIKPTSNFGN